jgi:hypothetical protein
MSSVTGVGPRNRESPAATAVADAIGAAFRRQPLAVSWSVEIRLPVGVETGLHLVPDLVAMWDADVVAIVIGGPASITVGSLTVLAVPLELAEDPVHLAAWADWLVGIGQRP